MNQFTLKSFYRIKSVRSKLAKEYALYASSNAGSLNYYLSDVDIDPNRGKRIIELGGIIYNRGRKGESAQ